MEKLTKEMILERINSSISKELVIERINSSISSIFSKEDIISIINSIESKSDWFYCHDELLSRMTQEEFIQVLDKKNYSYEIKGNKIIVTHEGCVDLRYLTSLPSDVVFKNGGYINLERLVSFPTGVEFRNKGNVDLHAVNFLPSDVVFRNGGNIFLCSLSYSILKSVEFKNKGDVQLIDKYDPSSICFHEYNNGYNLYVDEDGLDDFCTLETTVAYFRNKKKDFEPSVTNWNSDEITKSIMKILKKNQSKRVI
jgi:hypothetical protein